jgi:hypothetical protein
MHKSLDMKIPEMAPKPANYGSLAWASISTVLIIAFSFELIEFARVQDIWIDESTQLSGITLKLWEMLRWLSGADVGRFGVPADRMPPVSYLLDWLWLGLSGPSELGFRLFHSAFAIAGVVVLGIAALREGGPSAAIVVLTFFVLSPKLIQTGVEIRAYPIFFFVACVQTAVFLRLVSVASKVDLRLLSAFVLVCLIAIYTHFYGLVSSCAFFVALGIAFIRCPSSLRAIVSAFAIMTVASLGILPFVSSAVSQSAPAMASGRTVGEYFGYILRLLGDSANMVSVLASVLFFGGTLALLSAGMLAALARARCGNLRPFDWLFVVTGVGASAPVVADIFLRTFYAMSPNYGGWLLAPLGLLIGVGAVSHTGFRSWDRAGRIAAVCAMMIGGTLSTRLFLVHSAMFVHGPHRFVGSAYDETAGPKAIVYEVGAAWGFPYFPLTFSHKSDIAQYRAAESGIGLVQIRAGDGAAQPAVQQIESAVASYSHLLLIDVQLRVYRDLRQCEDQMGACPNFAAGVIEEALIGTGQWTETKVDRRFGLYDTQLKILQRVGRRVAPSGILDQ